MNKARIDMTPSGTDSPLVNTYITFGVQYGPAPRERHPVFDWVNGDGYVRISAPSREAARQIAFDIFGDSWAFDYDEKPAAVYAPLGELAHINLSMQVKPAVHDIVEVDGVIVARTRHINL